MVKAVFAIVVFVIVVAQMLFWKYVSNNL